MKHLRRIPSVLGLGLLILSCSDDATNQTTAPVVQELGCPTEETAFEPGDEMGHRDPLGAKAAGQARAAKITDASWIVQPEDARQKIHENDYLLINDKIAVYIENKGLSDGYARFGGEILSLERVGDDGRPKGESYYGETLMMVMGAEMIDPDTVSVIKDGSDGGEAVVRVQGKLKPIPFLGALQALFPNKYGLQAAYDYVLKPGSEKVTIRFGVMNPSEEEIDASLDEKHGFFHSSRNRLFSEESGYGAQKEMVKWAGFDGGKSSFIWRSPNGPLRYGVGISGFEYFEGPGFKVKACNREFRDYAEVIVGGPYSDGVIAALHREDGDREPLREVKGTVKDSAGAPVANSYVVMVNGDGTFLSRTMTDEQGNYVIHAPSQPVKLIPIFRGEPEHAGSDLAVGSNSLDLAFGEHATIHVKATDAANNQPVPVRIQVIPVQEPKGINSAYGIPQEARGRLHQEFALTGDATLHVPPGKHRVVVSHGYEWELHDTEVTVTAGQNVDVNAVLTHSVESNGVMCADFHIHSQYSADSSDPVEQKVKSAIVDGLEIPVSSEHEWAISFQPWIERFGMTKWSFGVPSEELTTFTWGHFGVVPLIPQPDKVNAGTVDWIGKQPSEVFAAAHALEGKPIVIVNHPSGGGFGAYFDSAGFTKDAGKGQGDLWSDDFDAVEVFNSSSLDENRNDSVADWLSLLTHGKLVPAVGSSDSHAIRTSPVGYPRTCIRFGHDDPSKLTMEQVRDGAAEGSATISGGIMVQVLDPNNQPVGKTLTTNGTPISLKVIVQSTSWVKPTELEVILDGKSILTEDLIPVTSNGPGLRFENVINVQPGTTANSFVLFHARGSGDLSPLHPGSKPFAVTNPIYLK
jgi:hypothetical protein